MRIGSSIALIVLGAILAFAVADRIDAVDLTLVGYILMGGGALGLILSLIFSGRRSSTVVHQAGPSGVREQRTERQTNAPPPEEF